MSAVGTAACDAAAPSAVVEDAREAVLVLDGFGVAFGKNIVLADISLRLPPVGTCVLMGPAGGGKSTLLRSLAGVNQAQPDLRQWGRAFYQGAPIGQGRRPVLVQQDARYLTSTVRENLVSSFPDRNRLERSEQTRRIELLLAACGGGELRTALEQDALGLALPLRRLLSVIRALATDAPLILLDESTAGLEESSAEPILTAVRWYAQTHAVLLVTHHQAQARALADQVVLLGGGRVQEDASASAFFSAAASPLTQIFLDSGRVALPSPGADPATLSEDVPPPPPLSPAAVAARSAPSAMIGPRDFRWVVPGQLGGLPRPGIVAELAEDIEALARLGVTTLVTLEETPTVPAEALAAAGICSVHLPIVDMEAPDEAEAARWCCDLAGRLDAGEVIAMHCRAGQGRTGTMLASQLIWAGASAIAALDQVRGINPRWVTSDAQVRFLARFDAFLHRPQPSPT